MTLSIELLEQSFEKIKPRAEEFAASFYENLFAANPGVQPLFANTEIVKQQKKLLNALILVVENLRNPQALGEVLNALGARHVGYGTIPVHYPAVGEALLVTFEQYLQQDWTPEVRQAWVDAFTAITALMLKGAGVNAPEEIKLSARVIPEKPATTTLATVEKIPDSPPPALAVELLESSFEKIKPRAEEFAASFYENLFAANPGVQPLFANTEIVKQQKKLLNALILVVENLRNPQALGEVLNALGARHVGYGTIPVHYPAVGKALLVTFEQYLQQDWTPEVRQAWVDAFTAITALMLKGARVNAPEEIKLSARVIPEKPATTTLATVEKIPDSPPPALAVELLESSFEKIKPRAEEFAASFYENLFAANPGVQPLFANTEIVKQQKKLLNALILVVENLRNPQALGEVLNALGARHVGYGTIPVHYPAVGEALLITFEQYLQQDWTPEVRQAWVDAFTAITALMLKGSESESSSKVIRDEKAATLEKPSEVQAEVKKEEKVFSKISDNSQQLQTQLLLVQRWVETLKKQLETIIAVFWAIPSWAIVVIVSITIMGVILNLPEDALLARIMNHVDNLSLVVALVLFIKEAPDRKKQFHYQAWSTVDAAHGVKVSYARIMALQDLNEDGVSLRGLDSPNADLVDINFSHADLSNSNLKQADLSNANLSNANLNNSNLSQAKLTAANLARANLSFARLSQANLNSANLYGANLICADLSQANMSGVNLTNASLSGANLEGTYLSGANLTDAKVSAYELSSAFLEGAIMPDGSKYQALNT